MKTLLILLSFQMGNPTPITWVYPKFVDPEFCAIVQADENLKLSLGNGNLNPETIERVEVQCQNISLETILTMVQELTH